MVNLLAVNVKSNIYIEVISKGFEKIRRNVKEVTNEFKGFKRGAEIISEKLQTMNNQLNHLNRRFKAGTMSQKSYANATSRIHRQMDMLRGSVTQTSKKMDQFHAELLSVMFFGMAMSAALSGMTQRAKESSGALALWGEMLEDLFLPIMESVMPEMENFTETIEGMDEGTKKNIGAIVLIIEALSKLVMSLGMAGLAWFGFTQMAQTYPKLAKKITKAIKFITTPLRILWKVSAWVFKRILLVLAGFSATAILILSLIFGVILLAWIKNWGNMKARFNDFVDGIKDVARGIGKSLSGIIKLGLGLVKGVFTGEWDLWSEGWQNFVDGIGDIINGLKTSVSATFTWLSDMFKDLIQYIKDLKTELSGEGVLSTIRNRIGAPVGGAMDWLSDLLPFANGGIVTRPTAALIGERGPEAIVPLGKMGGMGTTVNINNPVVRNDSDINAIAEQVSRVLEDNRRRFR